VKCASLARRYNITFTETMAMQRGVRPPMLIGKLKAPGVFGQQDKPAAEPAWRAGTSNVERWMGVVNINTVDTP